jgi:hypothetical protein
VSGGPKDTYIIFMDYLLAKQLILEHGGRRMRVECMMVEVKSSNDRVDSRQEDWLNVIDMYGKAWFCKFERSFETDNARLLRCQSQAQLERNVEKLMIFKR